MGVAHDNFDTIFGSPLKPVPLLTYADLWTLANGTKWLWSQVGPASQGRDISI